MFFYSKTLSNKNAKKKSWALLKLFSYFIANISLMKTLKNNNKWFTNEKNVPLVIKMLSKYNNCPKF